MNQGEIYIFDGAMGTMLQQRGLQAGQSPEELNLTMPEVVESVHLDYLQAGADIIITNTFGGSRLKLAEYGMAEQVREINQQAVKIAKAACQKAGHGLVAASMGPTGHFVAPLGEMSFDEMYNIYAEQAQALTAAEPDYLLLETFSDLGEMRAALLACRDAGNIPVICSMTYTNGRTLTGAAPAAVAVTLEALGAAVIGCNCSGGPQELQQVIAELAKATTLPLIVQPNAGLPIVVDNQVQYPLGAEQFAEAMQNFMAHQVTFMGGCCGTTPEHIRALKKIVADYQPEERSLPSLGRLASRETVIEVGGNKLPKIIGERINPTARKKLAQSLLEGDLSLIQQEAEQQIAAGAHLLDINVGAHGVDEAQVMEDIVGLLQQGTAMALCLDSTNPVVLEKGLKHYHGKALVNSVNGEQAVLDKILPLVKRYGAGVVGLTLDEQGIPETAEGRFAIAKKIVAECEKYGIARQDIYIDSLVMTVGSDPAAPMITLETMAKVKELGVNLLLGVSNVSHGLPNRPKINGAFLAMAIGQGLDIAIINPLDELMNGSWQSASLLCGRDERAENYLACNTEQVQAPLTNAALAQEISLPAVAQAVVKGSANIEKLVQALLEQGVAPLTIINEGLIIGLNEVGERYEKGIFFLPQLMLSAETAQRAFNLLEKNMPVGSGHQKGKMVIGTVKGDIHDIGKNMVAVMVKNHGYQVIDLGKNVPAEDFIEAVVTHQAEYLGLSALMTTTMQEIPNVIALLRQRAPQTKVIVGGAVITEEFAREVGADGYGKDAIQTVKLMEKLREGMADAP